MSAGVKLSLFVGPAAPVPAPRAVIEALESVEITSQSRGRSAFQLVFELDKRSPLHTLFMLTGGSLPPIMRVVLAVSVRGVSEVLIDGVMTNHEVSPGGKGAAPKLTITGEDLARVMDHIDFSGTPFPAMPPEARVLLILAKYAPLGVIPMVIPSVLLDVPIPVERIPTQSGKDLGYIEALAEDVGYVFYLEAGPVPGTSVAYWGPEIKVGVPQKALNVDMDIHTNVESMSFSIDTESSTLPVLLYHDSLTKAPIPIPVPNVTPLNPPLGAVMPLPKKIEWISGTGKYGPVRTALVGLAKAAATADAVSATGSLDVLRYGRPLRARRLVGVRGAGTAWNGLWYVRRVTHRLRRGEYRQEFSLSRNGLISTVPTVPSS